MLGRKPVWLRCQNRVGIVSQTSPHHSLTFFFGGSLTNRNLTGPHRDQYRKLRRPSTSITHSNSIKREELLRSMKSSLRGASPYASHIVHP